MAKKTTLKNESMLDALLHQVPQHGWTDHAVRAAASGKIRLADLMAAFPNGIPDALRAFSEYGEVGMLNRLAKHKLIQMRVRDRVATAVWEWLNVMAPHRDAVAAAVRSSWQPAHAWLGARAGQTVRCHLDRGGRYRNRL